LDRAALLDPETCKECHADHYAQWSGSMHAYAGDDPIFVAMNARGQRETNGALGTFCVNCHAPMAVREKVTTNGTDLATLPAKFRGVTCYFCHDVEQVQGTHDDPLLLANDVTMRGPLADAVTNTAHHSAYAATHDRDEPDSAQMCGACHDIQTGHGANIERTLQEWQASVFSQVPGGATCGQCHMAQSTNLQPIAQAPGVFARRAHAHTFAAVDTAIKAWPQADVQAQAVDAFLATTVQSAVCVTTTSATTSVRVIMDNVAAGHSFPSGSAQDRRLWVELVASSGGSVVYQSGVVPDGSAVTALTDPDLWLMRDCIFDETGKEVNMFWQAASYEGNAMPGQATFDSTDPRYYQTHLFRDYPRSGAGFVGTVDKVTLRLRLQPIGRDVLDDLVQSGDLEPASRDAVTTRAVGATLTWTPETATTQLIEGRTVYACLTTTNLNVKADKVPAPMHTKCGP
jgi:hypothetical protein